MEAARFLGRAPIKNIGEMHEPIASGRTLTDSRTTGVVREGEGLAMVSVVPIEVMWAAGAFIMVMAGFLAAAYSE
jgi:hypothetical protein